MSTQPPRLRGLLVVVPARDEEQLLGRCLAAISLAVDRVRATHRDLATAVLVVADQCVDSSADIARRAGARVLEIEAGCVGTARRAGVDAGVALLPTGPAHQTWVASTDADSRVPAAWLEHQVDLATSGTRLVIGRVTPDRDDVTDTTWARWHRRHTSVDVDAHIHGANLGFRLDDYLAAGGWPRLPQHEDQHLVNALLAAGVPAAAGLDVITSGRLRGRVPGGFSGYLRKIDAAPPGAPRSTDGRGCLRRHATLVGKRSQTRWEAISRWTSSKTAAALSPTTTPAEPSAPAWDSAGIPSPQAPMTLACR